MQSLQIPKSDWGLRTPHKRTLSRKWNVPTWNTLCCQKWSSSLKASKSKSVVRFKVWGDLKAVGYALVNLCRGKVNSSLYLRHIPAVIGQSDRVDHNSSSGPLYLILIGWLWLLTLLRKGKTDMRPGFGVPHSSMLACHHRHVRGLAWCHTAYLNSSQ